MGRMSIYREQEKVAAAQKLLSEGRTMIIFDLETTGLSESKDRILSFSAMKVEKIHERLVEKERINLYINPGFHIPENITEINHISDKTVEGSPKEPEAAAEIRKFLGEDPFLCGYNSRWFDEKFLKEMYKRVWNDKFHCCLHLDVYRMVKEKLDLPSYKLASVSSSLKMDSDICFHNSMDDVVATKRVLELILPMYRQKDQADEKEYQVIKVSYWDGPSARCKRIYVQTFPESKTYYDIYRKEWRSDSAADLAKLRRSVFTICHVKTEAELEARVKTH